MTTDEINLEKEKRMKLTRFKFYNIVLINHKNI